MNREIAMFARGFLIALLAFELHSYTHSFVDIFIAWIYTGDCILQIMLWIADYYKVGTKND